VTLERRLSPTTRRRLLLLAWLVATGLLAASFRAMGWERTVDVLRRASVPWLAAAALANLSLIALWAWQSLVLLPPEVRVGFRRMLGVTALATTATNTAPPLLGKAAGVALLAERGGVGGAVALSLLAQHQVVEGVAKVVMILVAARVAPLAPWMRDALVALTSGVVVLALALVVIARRSARWGAALSALRSPRRLALGLAIALGMKGTEALAWLAVERAFGASPAPGSPFLALAAVNLASSVGVSPGNLGVYEAAGTLAYRSLGVPGDVALALAVAGHACYLLPLAGAGWARRPWAEARAAFGRAA
jgi:glycosyltransferase 2 family protein